MIRTEIADDLRQQISWIEDIDGHKFPGWLNVTNAIRRAVVYLYPLLVLVTDKSDQCPRCGRQLAKRYQTNYCPKCGQAVEWPARKQPEQHNCAMTFVAKISNEDPLKTQSTRQ